MQSFQRARAGTSGPSPRLYRLLAILLLALCAQRAAAADPGFDCGAATAGDAQRQRQAAQQLLGQTWDVARLACAAQTLAALANKTPGDDSAQLAALLANAKYIYYLDRIVLYDLGHLIVWYVNDVPSEKLESEAMVALDLARKEQKRLLQQSRDGGFNGRELQYFEARLIGAQAQALPLLKEAVAADPPALHGEAHALLAATYYELPDIVGGDLDQAIIMMRAARQRAPENPRFARLLAGYLLDKGDNAEARKILEELGAQQSPPQGLQLLADQLRAASDLATRMGDAALAQQLSTRRQSLLVENPFLLSRKVVSAMGHFGSNDPMQDPQQAQDTIPELARACLRCHQHNGGAAIPGWPPLSDLGTQDIAGKLRGYRDRGVPESRMSDVAHRLSDEDIRLLAEFYGNR